MSRYAYWIRVGSFIGICVGVAACQSCGSSQSDSSQKTSTQQSKTKQGSDWARMRERYPAQDRLVHHLIRLADQHAGWMVPDGDITYFSLNQKLPYADYRIVVTKRLCYKVLAVGEDSIHELDLEVYNTEGFLIEKDNHQGRVGWLGKEDSLCPGKSQALRVHLKASRGHGRVAVQLIRSVL